MASRSSKRSVNRRAEKALFDEIIELDRSKAGGNEKRSKPAIESIEENMISGELN